MGIAVFRRFLEGINWQNDQTHYSSASGYTTSSTGYFSMPYIYYDMLTYNSTTGLYDKSNTINANFSGTERWKVNLHYVLQDLNDSSLYTVNDEFDDMWYTIANTRLTTGAPSGFSVKGYSYAYTPNGTGTSSGATAYLYHNSTTNVYYYFTRNSYNITFYNDSETYTTPTNIKYEAPIYSYGTEPSRPSGIDDDYEFGGWYKTADCFPGTEFDFGTVDDSATMPYNNLIVHAKWIKPEYTVTFNPANSESTSEETVEKYGTVTDFTPVRGNYTFAGWYREETTGELSHLRYVFDFPVTYDFTLVAKWTMTYTVQVEIYDKDGKIIGELPEEGTLTIPGEVDEEGNPVIEPPYELDGYGVDDIIVDDNDNKKLIVRYRPVSDPPEINDIYEGDETVSGTGVPDSKIIVTFPDGSEVTTTVDQNGNWSVLVPKNVDLTEGEEVTATQKEPKKSVSEPADETVKAYTSPVEYSDPPEIDSIYEGDKTVSGTGVPGAVIVVTFPDDSQVTTVVDEDGNWTVDVPSGVTLLRHDKVKARQKESGKIISAEVSETVQAVSTPRVKSKRPVINRITEGDDTVTGTGIPGSEIEVTFPDGSKETTIVDGDGNWTVDVPPGVDLVEGNEVTATQTEPGKDTSGDQIKIVDCEEDEDKSMRPDIDPITEGDDTVTGTGEPGAVIEVIFPDGSTETAEVDEHGNWSVEVPDGVYLYDGDEVLANQTESGKETSENQIQIVDGREKSDPPRINTIYEGDRTVSGTGVPGSEITVTFPGGAEMTATVDQYGRWTVNVPPDVTLYRTDVVTATQTETGKTVSDESNRTVTYYTSNNNNNNSNNKNTGSSSDPSPSPEPSPSPSPSETPEGTEPKDYGTGYKDGDITPSGYVVGDGSGRDTGNTYDTIIIIGEGEVPLGSLIDDIHIKYLNGYPDGSVKPESGITRGEAASIFYRLLKNANTDGNASTTFDDVPSDSWYSLAISTLAELEVITGYPDGTFRPNNTITRAEFAAMASRFDRLILTTGTAFSDVPETHWAVSYINSAYVKGWVNGYSDYSFKPEQSISRAEVVKTVNAILKRNPKALSDDINPYNDITSSHWAYIDILEASIVHNYERDESSIEYWIE